MRRKIEESEMGSELAVSGKNELKFRFVTLRVRGHSYAKIAATLHVCEAALSKGMPESRAVARAEHSMDRLRTSNYLRAAGAVNYLCK